MSLRMGIVGLPNVGKSTLFKALTRKSVVIANYPFATIDPNVGIVPVPDPRLETLAQMARSAKIVPAAIEFVDIAGLVKGAAAGQGLGNAFLGHIRDVDAIVEVIRVFENAEIIHVEQNPDPVRDFEIIKLELILKDLDSVTRAVDKAAAEAKSGDKKKAERRDLLMRLKQKLESETLLADALLPEAEMLTAKEIGLLTVKPMIAVFNISDRELKTNWRPPPALAEKIGRIPYLPIALGVEADAAELSPEDAREFLGLAGIRENGLSLLIRKSYEMLGLITFFTTGPDETRAWTIPRDSPAPRAGRAIHSDFEDRFIRAEVIRWDELKRVGSWPAARDLGLLRVEGKEYIVKDGDVIEFKI